MNIETELASQIEFIRKFIQRLPTIPFRLARSNHDPVMEIIDPAAHLSAVNARLSGNSSSKYVNLYHLRQIISVQIP